jgi:hypothetical protein
MQAVGVKAERAAPSRKAPVNPVEAVRVMGRWWLRGWLDFTRVVGGGPEYLGGPRPVRGAGRDADHAAR